MKKTTKWMAGLLFALGATLVLGACASADTTHRDLANKGLSVVVRYDANGGTFGNDTATSPEEATTKIVDRFDLASVEKGIVKLLAPGDPARGTVFQPVSTAKREGYFVIGWYLGKTPRTDGNGKALDENGELAEETGLPQGSVYSDRWDFTARKLSVGDLTPFKDVNGKDGYELTLYAAWAHEYTYEYYRLKTDAEIAEEKKKLEENKDKEEGSEEIEIDPWLNYKSVFTFGSTKPSSVAIPAWDTETGAMNYGDVPVYEGHTIDKIYTARDLEVPYEELIPNYGEVNEENGTAAGMITRCYTTWVDGEWFHIYNAKQFKDNYKSEGRYEIYENLDFAEISWTNSKSTFNGYIDGKNHTFANLTSEQSGNDPLSQGGLFGKIGDSAEFKDIKFENITFTITSGTYKTGAQYGLLAGTLSESAKMENVSLSGTILIGNITAGRNAYSQYMIGFVSGNVYMGTVDCDVRVRVTGGPKTSGGQTVTTYELTATADEDGEIHLAPNPDPTKDPNQD